MREREAQTISPCLKHHLHLQIIIYVLPIYTILKVVTSVGWFPLFFVRTGLSQFLRHVMKISSLVLYFKGLVRINLGIKV